MYHAHYSLVIVFGYVLCSSTYTQRARSVLEPEMGVQCFRSTCLRTSLSALRGLSRFRAKILLTQISSVAWCLSPVRLQNFWLRIINEFRCCALVSMVGLWKSNLCSCRELWQIGWMDLHFRVPPQEILWEVPWHWTPGMTRRLVQWNDEVSRSLTCMLLNDANNAGAGRQTDRSSLRQICQHLAKSHSWGDIQLIQPKTDTDLQYGSMASELWYFWMYRCRWPNLR